MSAEPNTNEGRENLAEETVAVGIDFPRWMLNRIDTEAESLGLSRQALVNMWIAEKFEKV